MPTPHKFARAEYLLRGFGSGLIYIDVLRLHVIFVSRLSNPWAVSQSARLLQSCSTRAIIQQLLAFHMLIPPSLPSDTELTSTRKLDTLAVARTVDQQISPQTPRYDGIQSRCSVLRRDVGRPRTPHGRYTRRCHMLPWIFR